MRTDWDSTWMGVATTFAGRSLCTQSQVAAVIVTADNRLASTGYNGPPRALKLTETCDVWCPRGREPGVRDGKNYGLSCLAVHAEVNAIMRCDWREMQGGTFYGTRTPCHDCVKVLGNSGIARAVFPILDIDEAYHPDGIMEFLLRCGISVAAYNPEAV